MPTVWKSVHPLMPDISVDVSWTTNPSAAPIWASVTSRLRQYEARLYRQSELDEFQTGEFSVLLDNSDRALEPGYASSALYPNVIPRRKIRVQARTRPSFVASQTTTFVGTASPVVTKPVGTATGDLIIVFVVTESAFTLATPGGWTLGDDILAAAGDSQGAWFYKIAASEAATWTFTSLFSTTESGQAVAITYRGVDPTTPVHKKAEAASATTTAVSGPSVTPTIDGCTIVQMVGCDPATSSYHGTPDQNPPTAERVDNVDAGLNSFVYVQDYRQDTAAAIALDVGVTSDEYVAFQAALAPRTYDRVGGFVRTLPVSWPSQKDAVVLLQAADYGMALNRAQVTIDGYPEELAHLRIGRVLDAISVPAADRAIDTATHTVAAVPAQVEGQPALTVGALEHCRLAAVSDGGYLFVSRDGKVTFHNRTHRRTINATAIGVLGDTTGEIPYSPAMVAQMDDSRLWNRATVITTDGMTEESSDATSELTYWQSRRDDLATLLAKPGEAASLASLFVWRYKDARLRFPTVDLLLESSHVDMNVPALLGADVGTRFTVKRRPAAGGAAISQDVHVEGIRETVTPGMWKLSLDVGAADPSASFWTLGSSTLNSTAIIGY